MDISTSNGPSWAEILTAVSSAVLTLVAIGAGIIALRQFKFMDEMERRRQAFRLIRDYTTPTYSKNLATDADMSISPLQAAQYLINASTKSDDFVPPENTPDAVTPAMALALSNYYILRNYLDELDDLQVRNIIDRNLFLSRQYISLDSCVKALRRFRNLVPGAADNDDLLNRIETAAQHFGAELKRSGGA